MTGRPAGPVKSLRPWKMRGLLWWTVGREEVMPWKSTLLPRGFGGCLCCFLSLSLVVWWRAAAAAIFDCAKLCRTAYLDWTGFVLWSPPGERGHSRTLCNENLDSFDNYIRIGETNINSLNWNMFDLSKQTTQLLFSSKDNQQPQ